MPVTTTEFSERFRSAVEGHPLAPATPHGRQKWVLEKLKLETGLQVSPNTMSKWVNGHAMPRADSIRKIAQVLKVDEVWLALGRKPLMKPAETDQNLSQLRGATLAVAGLIEMQGGRVTFTNDAAVPVDLHINLGGRSFSAIVVSPQETSDQWSFVVPEPIGDSRILAVVGVDPETCSASACFNIFDLTQCTRQRLGGFSIIVLEKQEGGKLMSKGHREDVTPVNSLLEMVSA